MMYEINMENLLLPQFRQLADERDLLVDPLPLDDADWDTIYDLFAHNEYKQIERLVVAKLQSPLDFSL